MGIDAHPKFEATRLAEGRQFLEVGSGGDGAVVGWYEATDKEIFPQRFKSYGPGLAFIVPALVVIFTVSIWAIGFTVFKACKWLKKSQSLAA